MTVDEILWLRDVGMSDAADIKYHLRAQWWGSKADTQVVFVPVTRQEVSSVSSECLP